MTNESSIQVLILGLDPICLAAVRASATPEQILERPYDLEKMMEDSLPTPPIAIICGPPPGGTSLIEVAQFLRMQYQEAGIFFVTSLRQDFDRKIFQKNGFTDAFLLPLDAAGFETALKDEIFRGGAPGSRNYRTVKLVDIVPGVVLDFDTYVFLPMNKKYIRFAAAGDELDQVRAERLNKHQIASVYVTQDQLSKFHQFTAKQLHCINSSSKLSETEKREKMQGAIRELLSGMFNDSAKDSTIEKGRGIVNDCQAIVKAYITESNAGQGAWYNRLLSVTNSRSNAYSHAANVATFAGLFSLGLGIGDPEQLAIAGLLHDIGMADLPGAIQSTPVDEMTAEEQAEYRKHVEFSISMIKSRKLIVPESVMKIIAQHHENFDGTGYPNKMRGLKLLPEAQVLALADEFDYLTVVRDGKARMTPNEAVDHLSTKSRFNPDFGKKLRQLFPKP